MKELTIDPVWFDGRTYEPTVDEARLLGLLDLVWRVMSDRRWRTLSEIHLAIHFRGSEAGISARLRDFRKERCGEHTVERRRRGIETKGLWEYRVTAWRKIEGLPPGLMTQDELFPA